MNEKKFVDGLIVKKPHDNAPDFVKARLSLKLDEFASWVGQWKKENAGEEWINIELKESKQGKLYAELDSWKPDTSRSNGSASSGNSYIPPQEDVPF